MFVLMPIAILVILWIKYESMKTKHAAAKSTAQYWEKEHLASHTRNKNIADLPIVTFTQEDVPIEPTDDYELSELFELLSKLSGKEFVNLSDHSNTDLKLAYGTGRFAYLAECDSNFQLLMRTLDRLGHYYIKHQEPEKAKPYLTYAIDHHTDLKHTYEQSAMIHAIL